VSRAKILLVEDDVNLGFVVKDNLEMEGFAVTLFDDGEKGLQGFASGTYDVCVLDVMLPRKDGFELARAIRQRNEAVPILFLTAKSMKEDRIAGFKTGADDYLTKPFSIEELVLRIEVFLRRSGHGPAAGNLYPLGDLVLDHQNLLLRGKGRSLGITQREADLLKLFCTHRDQVLRREDILRRIWGDDDYFMGRSLDVFISRLRKYLREDPRIEIQNVHGVGFRLAVNR
jgi:DNA-binding response OmpR family regulator